MRRAYRYFFPGLVWRGTFRCDQHAARDIWSKYQSLKEPEIVARGMALCAIMDDALREKIKPLLHNSWAARKGAG